MTQVGTLSTWRAIVQVLLRHEPPAANGGQQRFHERLALS